MQEPHQTAAPKATPCLQGDIIGDWREEVLLRTEDNTALRLYISPIVTDYRFHTFLEDPVYRISIATQNVAYNQPTQPGFYFGLSSQTSDHAEGLVQNRIQTSSANYAYRLYNVGR